LVADVRAEVATDGVGDEDARRSAEPRHEVGGKVREALVIGREAHLRRVAVGVPVGILAVGRGPAERGRLPAVHGRVLRDVARRRWQDVAREAAHHAPRGA